MRLLPLEIILTLCLSMVMATAADSHWSFQSPRRPGLPRVIGSWSATPVDAFIAAKHREHGLKPSAEASPETVLRRLSLDLRGLSPSVVEQTAFLAEAHPNATERLLDQLMASPAYGERMAQDWLDLARYADTTGHAADMPRTMWLYRDWVIEALNADQPYDQFTIEQLAGDLLPAPTEAQLIATGFHRNSPQALGNNPRKEEFRVKGIVDRLDVTGQTWLGLTLACAECHDHKHDPISTRDYYQLFAIFNNIPHDGETFHVHGPRMDVTRVVDGKPDRVQAQIMRELPEPRETYIHLRGDFEQRGDRVLPGLPTVFGQTPMGKSMNRLDLARWLVSPTHPLVARVEVNRHWQQFFGVGLVNTSADFGVHGEPPTHPELLDYLAVDFMENKWSRKRMHRLLLSSATYQQASHHHAHDPDNRWLTRAARFRLPAEVIRDRVLAAAGLLVAHVGGPSVFPPQPEGVGEFRDATAGSWVASDGANRYRRSLYTFWQRMSPHPAMTTFDAPSRETCTVHRARTNTPLQALLQWNEPTITEAARTLTSALAKLSPPDRVATLFRRSLAREPSRKESERFLDWAKSHGNDTAAWVSLATVVFNLDEFLTRE